MNPDFTELAKILDTNRNAIISDSHIKKLVKKLEEIDKRSDMLEKSLRMSYEELHRPFNIW